MIAFDAAGTAWHASDCAGFALLLCCVTVAVASAPAAIDAAPGVTCDLSAAWLLPAAILLPPVYAALLPVPLVLIRRRFLCHGIPHSRVFRAASLSLGYGLAARVFRSFPAHFAGPSAGTGAHALTWMTAVVVSYLAGSRIHHLLIAGTVKLSGRSTRIRDIEWNPQELQAAFVEVGMGALSTVTMAVATPLVVLTLPAVLLMRRFVMHPALIARSRTDAKTGLLNLPAWEAEARAELSRAARTQQPLAVALVDVDHFKSVNDTFGHLAGDRVLKAIAGALAAQSRGYDRVGRFGGEEFVLLLAQATQAEAATVGERLRGFVEDMEIPAGDLSGDRIVRVTISVGVTAITGGEPPRELADLLAAADSALYQAKKAGRNRVAAIAPDHGAGLQAAAPVSVPDGRPGF